MNIRYERFCMNDLTKNLHDLFRIANDEKSSGQTLLSLARHESDVIRGAVALNPSTPENAISILKTDQSKHVRDCLEQRESYLKLYSPGAIGISRTIH